MKTRKKRKTSVSAIILAAGVGLRYPRRYKQFERIHTTSILGHVLKCVMRMSFVRDIVLVVPQKRFSESVRLVRSAHSPLPVNVVVGGATRRESSFRALRFLETHPPTHVLLCDAARPMLNHRAARAVYEKAQKTGAAVLARPVVDSLARVNTRHHIVDTPKRSQLMTTYTPHCYAFRAIHRAHIRERSDGDYENIELMRRDGRRVSVVTTHGLDIKLTFAEDLPLLRRILSGT